MWSEFVGITRSVILVWLLRIVLKRNFPRYPAYKPANLFQCRLTRAAVTRQNTLVSMSLTSLLNNGDQVDMYGRLRLENGHIYHTTKTALMFKKGQVLGWLFKVLPRGTAQGPYATGGRVWGARSRHTFQVLCKRVASLQASRVELGVDWSMAKSVSRMRL